MFHMKALVLVQNKDTFYKSNKQEHNILFLFLGGMIALIIYSLIILFVTRHIQYMYYCFYVLGITMLYLVYRGLVNIYIVDNTQMYYILMIFHLVGILLFYISFLKSRIV